MNTFEIEESSESEYQEIPLETEVVNDTVDQKGVKINEQRITSRILTKYEKAYILGVRAVQLSMGAPPLVDIDSETDSLVIALKELKQKKVPFILRRKLPDNSFEEWNLNEMIIPYD